MSTTNEVATSSNITNTSQAQKVTGYRKRRNSGFWECMQITDSGCWEWQGYCDPAGYGQIRVDGRLYKTHRLAYQITHGIVPNVVRHKCDNPPCCNPDHLLNGTHADNVADRIAKGRSRYVGLRGEKSNSAKLSAVDVRSIRELYASREWTQTQLARRFNVHQTQISLIVNRKEWKEV